VLGRTGNVWHRRYDAQAILTDEAAVGRVRYVLANPQKARLVRDVAEWPGFVALAGREEQELDTVSDLLEGLEPLGDFESVLGLDKVLATDMNGRPPRPARARRPYAFGDFLRRGATSRVERGNGRVAALRPTAISRVSKGDHPCRTHDDSSLLC
jgi:hypothetical protein